MSAVLDRADAERFRAMETAGIFLSLDHADEEAIEIPTDPSTDLDSMPGSALTLLFLAALAALTGLVMAVGVALVLNILLLPR